MKRINNTRIKQSATYAKRNFMMMVRIIKKSGITVITETNTEVPHIVSVI